MTQTSAKIHTPAPTQIDLASAYALFAFNPAGKPTYQIQAKASRFNVIHTTEQTILASFGTLAPAQAYIDSLTLLDAAEAQAAAARLAMIALLNPTSFPKGAQ